MEIKIFIIAYSVITVISIQICRCAKFSIEVLHVKTGAQFGIFDIYSNTSLSGIFTSEIDGTQYNQYKSDIINDWTKRNIQKVKISLSSQGQVAAFFEFDGRSTTSMNWMSKSRLINSSYSDLDEASMHYCEIRFRENLRVHRMFYIAAPHNKCEGDSGWLVVIPSTNYEPCNVDQVTSTTIWYSDLKTKKLFNDVEFDFCHILCLALVPALQNMKSLQGFSQRRNLQKADSMTIEVEMDVNCNDSELFVENSTHILSGAYNEIVTYQCLEGFRHTSGDLIRRCTQTGQWSGSSPVCDKCCICKNTYINPNDTEAIDASVKKIKSELSIKANETSMAQRKKISATDNRPSSKVMGSILGGVLLGSLVFIIVVSDLALLLSHIKMAIYNIKQGSIAKVKSK
ncbi:uncharacterized protein LOC134274697 [Saccostrea cucullata]|uniref:uncharacterized protein LOC134274697 n=1 Tax=Saccostrea cuccullata TaxID=36930 RepID=UPI002ED25794